MFDALWNLAAGLFDKLALILPTWHIGIDLAKPLRLIADVIELIGYMFPPIILVAKLLGIWLALELALWTLFMVNWIINKIPFIG